MSDNHVDIFISTRDEVSMEIRDHCHTIKLGDTAKIFLLTSTFTIDDFMNKLNETYRQATARKESKDGSKASQGEKRETVRGKGTTKT